MSFLRLSVSDLSSVFLLAVVLVLIMTGIKYISKWKQFDRTSLMLLVMTTATFLLLSHFDPYTFSTLWRKFLILTIMAVILNYLFNMAVESKLQEKEKEIDFREGKVVARGALIGGAVLLIGFTAFTIWYTQPKDFNQTLEGIHLQLGNDQSEDVRIELDGELKQTLFGGAVYEGYFNIQGTETKIPEKEAEALIDYRNSGEESGTLFYYGSDIGLVGEIFVKDNFEEIVITYSPDESWTSDDGQVIAAPAQNREGALKLARELTNYELK
ncbi:hypothetical protein [Piscibacillus salipiscarius]|uniref:Uncharacterized protein n=1 Tax=Piscibacillus salipiscarius TaxID=299480 RepID=A0ABW5QCL5_9BACI|nr:hypothetical protein [Piscibacillus salipiscarius]